MDLNSEISKRIIFPTCPICLGSGKAKQFVAFAKMGGGSVSKTQEIKCPKCKGTGFIQ